MQLDLASLLLTSQLVSIACGLMFALDSAHGRAPFSGWFAAAFLSAPAASIFYLLGDLGTDWSWGFPVGNAISTLTVALTWIGARSVNGRSLPYWIALVVPASIAAAVLLVGPVEGPWTGALPFFLSFSAFSALACAEFWRGNMEPRLRHATILAVVCGVNAVWYMVRAIGLVVYGPENPVFRGALGSEVATVLLLVMIVVASLSLVAIGRERALRLAQALATRDDLTGLLNRREFLRRVEALSEGIGNSHSNFALLLFDLDHFKSINDTYGHLVGDEVLAAFARVAQTGLRDKDLLCRYGGEEFAALLPAATVSEAFAVAERIRHRLAASDDRALALARPTTSIGIAACRAVSVPLPELLDKADEALYRAKNGGRDKTVVYEKDRPTPSSSDQETFPLRVVGGGDAA